MTPFAKMLFAVRGGLGGVTFVLLYVTMATLPLLIARLTGTSSGSFTNELGTGFGMAAYALLLAEFWLTGRFRRISDRAGLDAFLRGHRFAAVAATVMIVAHIILSDGDPTPLGPIAAGALVLVFVGIGVRKGLRIKYEVWRIAHGVAAVLVAVVGFFHAQAAGRYIEHPLLSAYWGVLMLAALGSLVWVHVILPMRQRRTEYRVVAVRPEARALWTVELEPSNGQGLSFHAGQYAFLAFAGEGFPTIGHPFSFSSAPSAGPRLAFTIRENGDFTNRIGTLQPGTAVRVDGPYGHLSPENYRGPAEPGKGIVLIGGGVGFAPMMSILRERRLRGTSEPIYVFYAAQTWADIMWANELTEIAKTLGATIRVVLSRPEEGWTGDTGYIDTEYLNRHLNMPGREGFLYFICGSTRLNDAVLASLAELKIASPHNIHVENFAAYD
jgi:predicted ferric reductase